ncbi:MAG: Hsp20/alpha crystallin family protein [Bacteroidia bacterium]|nr:Hsp20/alpha crystallin family protein [Bacteroidia bacterium]
MSNIKKFENLWDVPSIFSDFFDTEKFFGNAFPNAFKNLPAANVKETEKEFKVELSAPGFKKDQLKIEMKDDILTIKGEYQHEKTEEKETYTRREFSQSSFIRNFQLPSSADTDKINAEYKDGILNIHIPKKEEVIKKSSVKEIKLQ